MPRAFRQLEPLWLLGQCESAEGVSLGKSCVEIMVILQDKNGAFIFVDLGKIETPCGGVCIHFCHSPSVVSGQQVTHLSECFLIL